MTATIPAVSPRPRGSLSDEQVSRLDSAIGDLEKSKQRARVTVAAVLSEGASFMEVSKATGLSTNTLQRWKREASE